MPSHISGSNIGRGRQKLISCGLSPQELSGVAPIVDAQKSDAVSESRRANIWSGLGSLRLRSGLSQGEFVHKLSVYLLGICWRLHDTVRGCSTALGNRQGK